MPQHRPNMSSIYGGEARFRDAQIDVLPINFVIEMESLMSESTLMA